MSEIYKAHIFCFAATESKNYINKSKTTPSIGTAIDGCDIVFDEKALIDGKWMFNNDNPDIIRQAKEQVEELKKFNDWIGILV